MDEDREDYAEQAEKLCILGATDSEMADFFGVSVRESMSESHFYGTRAAKYRFPCIDKENRNDQQTRTRLQARAKAPR